MTITERLIVLIESLGETVNSFSNKIEINQSTVASAIKRNKGVNSDFIEKLIIAFPIVNLEWLFTGSGDKFKTGDITNTITGDSNTTQSNTGGGHNVSIGGDTKAKKIIEKDKVIIELEQSAELDKQKIESLETRTKDLESLLKAKEEIIVMLKNK